MNYPFWDVGISYGWLMATISVLHVFVSHFAIGGGLYLVVTEHLARKAKDTARLLYLEKLSKFFILVTLVFGALSGVGIWFIIGLLNPAATELLIHNFVWGWATEWTFFLVEIASAILYYYGWKSMSARNHLIVGWVYFIAAWLSLVVINGILAFMLTPGDWLSTGDMWDGFFNATYCPTLFFRTGVCVMLAGLYTLLVASRQPNDQSKSRLIRYNAIWGLVGLAIMAPTFYWYWKAIPTEVMTTAIQTMATPITAVRNSYWLAGGLAAILLIFGILLSRTYHLVIGIVAMLVGLVWFGEFEWFRESIRKPWVVTGYMYANSLEVTQVTAYQERGMLTHMPYRTGDDGKDLFNRACRTCHTVNGYKGLAPIFSGTDPAFISSIARATHLLKGNMPPWMGTDAESEKLGAYLYSQVDRRPMRELYSLNGVDLGRKVFDIRCGVCHWVGGPSDKTESLTGLSVDDYSNILDAAADLGEGMPAFTADSTDRAALIEYLQTLKKGEVDATSGL
jgi:mono/diheme cytochrome c family protein/cytochrome bd-type quinol oxidase subunit 1